MKNSDNRMKTQDYQTVVRVYDGRLEYYPRVIKIIAGEMLYFVPVTDWTIVDTRRTTMLPVFELSRHPDCENSQLLHTIRSLEPSNLKAYFSVVSFPGQPESELVQIGDPRDPNYKNEFLALFNRHEFNRNIEEVVL